MNDLKVFENSEFGTVRTVVIGNEPWFVGKDVCEAFGDTNYRRSLSNVDNEDKDMSLICTAGGNQKMTIINESGLYSLLFQMQPQKAKGVSQNDNLIEERIEKLHRFKRWITHEVLPSIRKHGMYATEELLANPDLLISVAQELKAERERSKQLKQKIENDKPKTIFADAVATSSTSILIGDLAKIIKQNGVDIGQKRLFSWLRENGYLIKRKGADWNSPTQKSMEMELFEVKETAITHSDGHVSVSKTTKVTGKGQQYFINKFLQNMEAIA